MKTNLFRLKQHLLFDRFRHTRELFSTVTLLSYRSPGSFIYPKAVWKEVVDEKPV
jgi:hypothetical protein